MTTRSLQRTIPSMETSDGAGVRLRRSLGGSQALRLDPFLMLDEFYSDDPDDYLAGFPSHPHRGFETVTYMLDGRMLHEDSIGNRGELGPGDVQWMSAARGIIHSEMPQQAQGRMRGFQLWINLAARDKMKPAAYRDISAEAIPRAQLASGALVRVIHGTLREDGQAWTAPALGHSAAKLYLDILLPAQAEVQIPVDEDDSVFVYLYEGQADVGDPAQALVERAAAVLGPGNRVRLVAGAQPARLLLLAGTPIREPVVQYGPFVMNTRAEIDQALADYQAGRLAAP